MKVTPEMRRKALAALARKAEAPKPEVSIVTEEPVEIVEETINETPKKRKYTKKGKDE